MAVTPVNAAKTVVTAGVRVQMVSNTALKPCSVYIEALRSNTGIMYVGLVTVSSTVYIAALPAGASWSFSSYQGGRIGATGIQLSALYIDASVSGEKVQLTYADDIGG